MYKIDWIINKNWKKRRIIMKECKNERNEEKINKQTNWLRRGL